MVRQCQMKPHFVFFPHRNGIKLPINFALEVSDPNLSQERSHDVTLKKAQ